MFQGEVVLGLRYLRVRVFEHLSRRDSIIFLYFMGHRRLPVSDRVISIKDGPLQFNKMSKIWRLYV